MSLSQGIGLEFDDNFKSMGAMEGWKKMPKKGPKNVKKKKNLNKYQDVTHVSIPLNFKGFSKI